jgi:hypothetical protein
MVDVAQGVLHVIRLSFDGESDGMCCGMRIALAAAHKAYALLTIYSHAHAKSTNTNTADHHRYAASFKSPNICQMLCLCCQAGPLQ